MAKINKHTRANLNKPLWLFAFFVSSKRQFEKTQFEKKNNKIISWSLLKATKFVKVNKRHCLSTVKHTTCENCEPMSVLSRGKDVLWTSSRWSCSTCKFRQRMPHWGQRSSFLSAEVPSAPPPPLALIPPPPSPSPFASLTSPLAPLLAVPSAYPPASVSAPASSLLHPAINQTNFITYLFLSRKLFFLALSQNASFYFHTRSHKYSTKSEMIDLNEMLTVCYLCMYKKSWLHFFRFFFANNCKFE